MAKQTVNGKDELVKLAGKEFEPTDWVELNYEDIVAFADATGDHQWIHVDRERVKTESPYKVPIAHGYFTLSRIAGMFLDLAEVKGFKGVINYGLNKVRFPAPLKEGASYRLRMKCVSVDEIQAGVQCVYEATVEIKNEAKPACVAEILFRYFL